MSKGKDKAVPQKFEVAAGRVLDDSFVPGNLSAARLDPTTLSTILHARLPQGMMTSGGDTGERRQGIADAVTSLIASGSMDWLYTSIPLEQRQGLAGVARMMRLRRGKSTKIESVLGEPLAIVNMLIHAATSTDPDSGEVHGFPRVLFIGAKDEVWECGSVSLIGQIDELIVAGYGPPWAPPLKCRVISKSTTPPRHMYVLEILDQ